MLTLCHIPIPISILNLIYCLYVWIYRVMIKFCMKSILQLKKLKMYIHFVNIKSWHFFYVKFILYCSFYEGYFFTWNSVLFLKNTYIGCPVSWVNHVIIVWKIFIILLSPGIQFTVWSVWLILELHTEKKSCLLIVMEKQNELIIYFGFSFFFSRRTDFSVLWNHYWCRSTIDCTNDICHYHKETEM